MDGIPPLYRPAYERDSHNIVRDEAVCEALNLLGELMFGTHRSYSVCGLGSSGTDRYSVCGLGSSGTDRYSVCGLGSSGTDRYSIHSLNMMCLLWIKRR
jgi:hypothetical protein